MEGAIKMDAPIDGCMTYDNSYLGLRQDEEIVEMSLVIGNSRLLNFREYVFSVDEEVIYIPGNLLFDGESAEGEVEIVYQEGRDAAGRVIFQKGDADLANALRKGNIHPGVSVPSALIRIEVPKV